MDDCQNGKESAAGRDWAKTQRILDANFNRASEGYRIAEEYARFVIEDAFLTRKLKEARHALTQSFEQAIGETTRLAFRETQADVGTLISTESESPPPILTPLSVSVFSTSVLAPMRELYF